MELGKLIEKEENFKQKIILLTTLKIILKRFKPRYLTLGKNLPKFMIMITHMKIMTIAIRTVAP